MYKIYAYNQGSKSANALAQSLNIPLLRTEGAPFKSDYVFNWGASSQKRECLSDCIVYNHFEDVKLVSNKLNFFEQFYPRANDFNALDIPQYTTDRGVADLWLQKGDTVVVREILNGHSAQGLTIVTPEEGAAGIFDAPLYTKYIKKTQEYRVHVAFDKVISVQRKARNRDIPDDQVNWQVRNHTNGFIYKTEDEYIPDLIKEECIHLVSNIFNLHYGAIDLIVSKHKYWYVLEINTAPGLEGNTLVKYTEAFKKVME